MPKTAQEAIDRTIEQKGADIAFAAAVYDYTGFIKAYAEWEMFFAMESRAILVAYRMTKDRMLARIVQAAERVVMDG